MPGPASNAIRSSVLIGVTCDTTSTFWPLCSLMIRAYAQLVRRAGHDRQAGYQRRDQLGAEMKRGERT
jgi:hypothetical protein